MTDIVAIAVSDSVRDGPGDNRRLLTLRTRAPKFIHQETLRHRKIYCLDGLELRWDADFSYSVSSSRAIPFPRMLAEARDPALRAAPVYWGAAQKGMSPGAELDDTEKCIFWPDVAQFLRPVINIPGMSYWVTRRECACMLWDLGGGLASRVSEAMIHFADVHKSIANRMVENYVHANVLMTGTDPGWLNFFGLRLDGAADPTLRALAERCWAVWNESQPRALRTGEWHLPYADDEQSVEEAADALNSAPLIHERGNTAADRLWVLKRMSVARCAHLSYEAHDAPGERMSVEKCLEIHQRLVGSSPIHASPAEHQATPDEYMAEVGHGVMTGVSRILGYRWKRPELGGNLGPGWVQLRKTLPGEAVAPLPEAYR